MPDIDFERITVNMVPTGEMPVFHASQYETARPFIADLKWGDDAFTPGEGCRAEVDIRKVDGNIIVLTDDVSIESDVVSVVLPQQAVTCIGKNLGQIKIYGDDDALIGSLNFWLEVQPDPLAGGLTSETAIDNLTQQIEDIAQEVIGDDYYNKTETDALLATKADISDLPDMTNYYTKTQTDTLLNGKADASTTYTKTEVDNALALKANTADLATVATTGDYDDLINKPTIPAAQVQSDYAQADNTQVDYIKNKPDIAGMIADALLAVMPVETAGPASVANFNTDIQTNLVNVICTIVASQSGSGTPSPSNPRPISGYSACNVTANGTTHTIALGSTVYGGTLDVTRGKLVVTHYYTKGGFTQYNASNGYKAYMRNDLPLSKYIEHGKSNMVSEFGPFDSSAMDRNIIQPPYGSGICYLALEDTANADDVELVYELATPQTVQLTAQQVQAILGDNNVFADTGDTTVKYKVSIQKYVDDQ